MKTLINCFSFIFLMILLGCTNVNESTGISKHKTILEYRVNSVNFNLETFFSITCKDFEIAFKQTMKSETVRNEKKIRELEEILNGLEKNPEKYHPDVRGQLLIKYDNNSIDTLCIGKFGLEFNGVPMTYDDRVFKLIYDKKEE